MALKLILIVVFFILFIITIMGVVIKIIKRNNGVTKYGIWRIWIKEIKL